MKNQNEKNYRRYAARAGKMSYGKKDWVKRLAHDLYMYSESFKTTFE